MELSPSAFIPFCEFGLDKSKIGVKIDLFVDYICNAFEPKIHDDQLCYEVDLNRYKDEKNLESQLRDGLSFVLDFNVERQWVASDEKEIAYIYLDTIGLMNKINKNNKNLFYFLEPVKLFGKGEYNLNVLKEIQVTEDFQSLGEEITGCQTRDVDCRPNIFYESSKYHCGCVPLDIALSEKVRPY